MLQTIDINIFNDYPPQLFKRLPEQAKDEINNFVKYITYKYQIVNETQKQSDGINYNKAEFLSFLKKGFSVTEEEINQIEQTTKDINNWNIQKF